MDQYLKPIMGEGRRARMQTTLYRKCFENGVVGMNFITVNSSTSLNIGNPSKFTIRAWCRLGTLFNNNGLVSRTSFASSQGDWALGVMTGSTTRMAFRLNNNAVIITSPTDLSARRWYFIEASYDQTLGSNNMKLFIDGVLNVQGNYSTVISNSANPIIIGGYFSGANMWIGQIAEVELSIGIIRNTANYTPPKIITPDGYSAFYIPMSDRTLMARDFSGKGNHGAISGTPAGEPTDPAIRRVTGIFAGGGLRSY